MTLSEALEKLQVKGLLKPLDPKPIPHPMHRGYNPHAHYKYHQGGGHTTNKCHKCLDWLFGFIVYLGFFSRWPFPQ